jgi:BASS family bile acid:Na+ symporter
MADLIKNATPVVLIGFLVCTMLSTGLGLALADALRPLRDWQLVSLMLVLNFILAPAFAWLLTVIIPLERGYAIGLILLGAAAGAPFLPTLAKAAGRQVSMAAASMVLLTAGTIVFMPLALPWLIPGLKTSPWNIARPLLLFIVLPLIVGMVIRAFARKPAEIASLGLAKLGSLCLLLLCLMLVFQNARKIFGMAGTGAVAATILHMALLFGAGWLLGCLKSEARGVLSLGAGARNFGAALASAADLHDPSAAVMITVSAIVALLGLFPVAGWMARHIPQAERPTKSQAKASP